MSSNRVRCRVLFRKMTKETSNYVKKQFEAGNDISWRDAVKGHTITQGLRYSLATGNWGIQGDAAVKPGVAQVCLPGTLSFCFEQCSALHCPVRNSLICKLACKQNTNYGGTIVTSIISDTGCDINGSLQALNRLTFASTLSHLRRVNCPTGREGKNPKPRQLHNSQWGVICPAETPEGHQVGLVKNLALMAQVTVGRPPEGADELELILSEWNTDDLGEIAPGVIAKVRLRTQLSVCMCAVHACSKSC